MKLWLPLLALMCACAARPGTPVSPGAPGLTPERCDLENPPPETAFIDPALSRERHRLARCLRHTSARHAHVQFTIDRYGYAENVTVNGQSLSIAATCVSRVLSRINLRAPTACPTSAEFTIMGW